MYFKCQNCGKRLSDPESMKRGYGPECWEKMNQQLKRANQKSRKVGEDEIPGQMDITDFPEYMPDKN